MIGQIVDTNSQWIAQELNKIGVSVYQISSVSDEQEHILNALEEAEKRADVILITGGLGPTKDDITKHTLAKYFDDHLILDANVVAHVKQMFDKRGIPFTNLNRDQGLVPSTCKVLHNALGTAPGMLFDKNNTIYISMPGVPYEMKGLVSNEVIPFVKKRFALPHISHLNITTYGIGESALAELLENWEITLPSIVKLAYLPSPGSVKLRLTAKHDDKELLAKVLAVHVEKLKKLLEENNLVFSLSIAEDIVTIIGQLLQAESKTLSVAESCTGGYLAAMLTEKPGASSFFRGGIIAYDVQVKKNQLNVSAETIIQHSVVSCEVAAEMAIGARKMFDTDFAIAITGNAGPTVDKTTKDLGVVCIAVAMEKGVYTQEYNFGKPRTKVIQRSAIKSLELLRKEIVKKS